MTSGIFGKKFICSMCEENPKMPEVWGCIEKCKMSQPTFTTVKDGTIYKYYNCPVRFIPQSIFNFLQIKRFYDSFPGAHMPSYENVNNRFLEMNLVYTSELNRENIYDNKNS